MKAAAGARRRDLAWALTATVPGVLLMFAAGDGADEDRVRGSRGRHVPAACRGDGEREDVLFRHVAAGAAPAALARERGLLAAMQSGGGARQTTRSVVARALSMSTTDRYALDPLVLEADQQVLTHVLQGSSAFRRALNPPPPKPPPPRMRPQQLLIDESPETTNDLLEALRESPKGEPEPVRPPPPPDPWVEAARFAVVLQDDVVKSELFLVIYHREPQVLASLFARHRGDVDFPGRFETVVKGSLRTELRGRLSALIGRVLVTLAARGLTLDDLDAPAGSGNPPVALALRDEITTALERFDAQGWTFDVSQATLLARKTVGHYRMRVVMRPQELLVSAAAARRQAAGGRWWPEDGLLADESLVRARLCHQELCFGNGASH
jgi:hypothetical protein